MSSFSAKKHDSVHGCFHLFIGKMIALDQVALTATHYTVFFRVSLGVVFTVEKVSTRGIASSNHSVWLPLYEVSAVVTLLDLSEF